MVHLGSLGLSHDGGTKVLMHYLNVDPGDFESECMAIFHTISIFLKQISVSTFAQDVTSVLGLGQVVGDILEVIVKAGMHSQFIRGDNNVRKHSGLMGLLPRLQTELLNYSQDLGDVTPDRYANDFVAVIGNLMTFYEGAGCDAHGESQWNERKVLHTRDLPE